MRMHGPILLLLSLPALFAAAPPARWRNLTAEEEKEAAALAGRVDEQANAAAFEKTVRAAEALAAYRAARQGPGHWQVLDARWRAKDWRRRTSVRVKDRRDFLKGLALLAEGYALIGQGRARDAEKPIRQAVDLMEKTAGKEHPDTAQSYYDLGWCFEHLGKITEAIRLHRQALALRRRVLGKHPATAANYGNLAFCAEKEGRWQDAEALHRQGLDILEQILGEYHPGTALFHSNLGSCLLNAGQHAKALPHLRRAIAGFRKTTGEENHQVAILYNNMAGALQELGRANEALPFHRRSLEIRRTLYGERHQETAQGYMTLASGLRLQGRVQEALTLASKGLDLCVKTLGEQAFLTGVGYVHVASCLKSQGKVAEALSCYRQALAIFEKHGGKLNPNTGLASNNVASCLQTLGRIDEALALHAQALAAFEKNWGKYHAYTANSYHNTAHCLMSQGKASEALPYFDKALEIRLKVWGEAHPHTVFHYHHLSSCLEGQGEAAKALDLHRKGLAIRRKLQGNQHPETAASHVSLAVCLRRLGKTREAATHLDEALLGFEFGRLAASEKGFDRSRYQKENSSPRELLAATLVRLGETERAWQEAESSLGRGLLDALAGPSTLTGEEREKLTRLSALEAASLPLLGVPKPDEAQRRRLQELGERQARLRTELARVAVRRGRGRVLGWEAIQKHLPATAAIVFWLDEPRLGDHLGCVLRATGAPAWVRLPGSGKAGDWNKDDDALPDRAYAALTDRLSDPSRRTKLLRALHGQRLAPLAPHLKGVRQLLVVPSGGMVALPVESLSDRYTVSYTPSASIFARHAPRSRPLSGRSVLVLADPTFSTQKAPHSGVVWPALPGTRLEARTLQKLTPGATVLLGSDATEDQLSRIARANALKRYRLLHLATHGEVNALNPEQTALILAQDRLPDLDRAARETLAGKTPRTGRLTVGAILREWKLDADLVTLSACQSGLGPRTPGEGMLGFAQALLEKGARSVLLSRWKVDDAATGLLMRRFYQNVLGQRPGLDAPLGRAEALAEARTWLRTLPRKEAESLLTHLTSSLSRGERSKVRPVVPANRVGKGERPFEHPYFWAAFVLVGDPR